MGFTKTLKVGIDLDGVLTDPTPIWQDVFNSMTSHSHGEVDLGPEGPIDWDHFHNICAPCFSNVLKDPELVLACTLHSSTKSYLIELARYAELHVVTNRRNEVIDATHDWLVQNDIINLFATVNHFHGDKAKFCYEKGYHFHIDDSPKIMGYWEELYKHNYNKNLGYNELMIHRSKLPNLIVMDRAYNRIPGNWNRVKSWREFVQLMTFESLSRSKHD